MDNRFKAIIFGLIAAVAAIIIAMEIGAGNYVLPILILIGMVCLGTVCLLFPKAPLDGSILICALCAIMITGKGFVYIGIGNILFTTEIILGILVVMFAVRVIFRQWPILPMETPMALPLFLFFVYLLIHLYFDTKSMGIMALRDAGTVYYAGFFLASYQLARNHNYVHAFYRVVPWAILPAMILMAWRRLDWVSLVAVTGPLTFGARPLIAPHVDASDHVFIATILLLFQLSLIKTGRKWLCYLGILMITAYVVIAARGTIYVAFLATSAFILLSGKLSYFRLMIPVAIIAGISFGIAYASSERVRSNERVAAIKKKVEDLHSSFTTDARFRRQTTTDWRLYWWQHITDRVMASNPIYGLGLGADLQVDFIKEFYRNPNIMADQSATRGAHNAFFTILGRLGIIGAALFTWVVIIQLIYFRRAILLWRYYGTKLEPMYLYMWGAIITGFTTTFLQYTWEGPYSALPFWTISGIAYFLTDKLWREYKAEMAEKRRAYLEKMHQVRRNEPVLAGST